MPSVTKRAGCFIELESTQKVLHKANNSTTMVDLCYCTLEQVSEARRIQLFTRAAPFPPHFMQYAGVNAAALGLTPAGSFGDPVTVTISG